MSAHDALDNGRRGLLSDATIDALQLLRQPFTTDLFDSGSNEGSAAEPFSDDITEEQLSEIKQALITGDDLLLILGEPGSGKSTLLQQLDTNSGLRIQCFPVTGSDRFSTYNLFAGMLEAFKIKPPDSLKGILDELIPCLQTMVGRNTLSVIVLDDAHLVKHGELTQLLSGMLYMNSQDETLLRVALSATEDFEDLIPDLLPEGADLPYSSLSIEGFSPQRATAYLDYRLQLAGFDMEFPFTERDMASLVDHSAGLPAELHALTADVLNEKYGRLDRLMPGELAAEPGEGFLQSRKGKLALGALATVLILGGILMFMPSPENAPPPVVREPLAIAPQPQPPSPSPDNASQPSTTAIDSQQQSAAADENSPAISTDTAAGNIDDASAPPAAIEEDIAEGNRSLPDTITPAPETPAPDNATVADNSVPAGGATDPGSNQSQAAVEPAANQPPADAPSGNEPLASATTASQPSAGDQSANTQADNSQVDNTQAGNSQAATEPGVETPATENPDDTLADASLDDLAEASLDDLLESPTWILVQDESLYTIQMSASTELESVRNFLRRNPLPRPNSIFSFEREGEVWFALVHGVFPSVADARRAVEQMSRSAQRDQPWIRSIARIKGIYREE